MNYPHFKASKKKDFIIICIINIKIFKLLSLIEGVFSKESNFADLRILEL